MLIKGEKYACEACVRGHRVSSCTHSDRQLLHVNKKGRPVSQCQHCRSLRKARSQHVRCDCHDKAHAKEDCPHLKNEIKPDSAANSSDHTPETSPSVKSEEPHTCCCGHGARCTCSLKKDPTLDTVQEDIHKHIQPKEPRRSRISSLNNHEGRPTVFSNGHHKPVHKINDAHNHCGAPYRVPSRSIAMHGQGELAQRSADSLPLLKQAHLHADSPLHNSVTSVSSEMRQTKSEHGSPDMTLRNNNTSGLINELHIPPLSPNAYSYSPFDSQGAMMQTGGQQDIHLLPDTIPDSWFTTYDEAHAMDAMPVTGLNDQQSVDWSTFDFANVDPSYQVLNNGFLNSQASYMDPYNQISRAGLMRVNSSSGDISEAEETSTLNRPSHLRTVSNASNDHSSPEGEIHENYRPGSNSSYLGTPQANVLAGTLDNLDIDEYVKQTVDQQRRMAPQPHLQENHVQQAPSPLRQSSQASQSAQHIPVPQPRQLSSANQTGTQLDMKPGSDHSVPVNSFPNEHAFTISEAQAYAHMRNGNSDATSISRTQSPLVQSSMIQDPMWSGIPDGDTDFKLDDDREDEDWVR